MVPSSQRFDNLFSWMGEQQAIELLSKNVRTLDNPGIKYIAATWGCLNLGLLECRADIENLLMTSTWEPLRWTCAEVLRKL